MFLESTGSLVLDRVNHIAYAAISPRTSRLLAHQWCADNHFELVLFETENHLGCPIYHTDLMMFVGTSLIGVCLEAIKAPYREIVKSYVSRHHEILPITPQQIQHFCANCLEVTNTQGDYFLVMSSRAVMSLRKEQKSVIDRYYKRIIHSDLALIERYGGGSAHCLLAELF